MTLDALLKPWPSTATVEVQDAKGLKVFKREVATDDYGMTTLDLPLSTEPNLGVWKLTALAGEQKTQLDVRVEEYVLPKYEVVVDIDKDWVLTDEAIQGVVSGEYSFGKPVVGDFEIVAWRYVGQWEEYARASGTIDGEARFTIPQVRYVAGVPAAGGQGQRAPGRYDTGEGDGIRGGNQQAANRGGRSGGLEGDTREQHLQTRLGHVLPGHCGGTRRVASGHQGDGNYRIPGQPVRRGTSRDY